MKHPNGPQAPRAPRTALDPRPSRHAAPWRLLRTLTLLLVAVALSASAVAQVVVTDALGREVALERPAQRIVAMIPTHTEKVCALGACDRLVGRDTFSDHPARVLDLPDLGSAFSPDLERLLALDPDLILTDAYSGLVEALEGVDVAVYAGTPETVAGIGEVLHDLGVLLGTETEAAVLRGRIEGAVGALADAAAERDPAPRVFLELDPTPYTAGPASYLGELLTLAGGANVVPAGIGDFPALDPEQVIEADPQVIVLFDAPYGESADTVAARPGWGQIIAVRDGKVVELSDDQADLLSRAGPRLPDALRLLIDLLDEADR
ncbi:MAG: helical backbone metal receptor [Trueperaceae bacterium]